MTRTRCEVRFTAAESDADWTERDWAVEHPVVREEHFGHAAARDLAPQLVAASEDRRGALFSHERQQGRG